MSLEDSCGRTRYSSARSSGLPLLAALLGTVILPTGCGSREKGEQKIIAHSQAITIEEWA